MAERTICVKCEHYEKPFGDLPAVQATCRAYCEMYSYVTGKIEIDPSAAVLCKEKNDMGQCPDYEGKEDG